MAQKRGYTKPTGMRLCNNGYPCGDTCISKKKVCLKKLSSNRAKEMATRFSKTLKATDFSAPEQKSTPDLITDV